MQIPSDLSRFFQPTRLVLALFISLTLSTHLSAQKNKKQQQLAVVVLKAHVEPNQPASSAKVSLSYIDGSSRITDALDVTNPKGQAWLVVSPDVTQRADVRIEITGISDFAIYQPADGQLTALPASLTIKLLPKGSPALLGATQIEAMLHRSLLQINSLQKQNNELKSELASAQTQKADLTAALAEWATENGFPLADVNKQVRQWAQDIQQRADQATLQQKALAEIALKHYGTAAQLFSQAGDADDKSMDDDEKKFLDERRTKLRQLMQDKLQAANAFQLNLQYHQATLTLVSARDRAAAEFKRFPEDNGIHDIWANAFETAAIARRYEAEVAPAADSLPLLSQSIDDLHHLADDKLFMDNPQNRARMQNALGNTLQAQGIRGKGAQAIKLLDSAAQAHQLALAIYTKDQYPQLWARTQISLGNALVSEAKITRGDKAAALFDQALQAFQATLQVRTKTDSPNAWANTQLNIGFALWAAADRSSMQKAPTMYEQSEQALQNALLVFNKTDTPQAWARTQMGLCVEQWAQGRADNNNQKANELLDSSIHYCQNALQVYNISDLPQDWARTQMSLGNAWQAKGYKSNGQKSLDSLNHAVEAFQNALSVFTRDELPQNWAVTQLNLGVALMNMGKRLADDKSIPLFEQSTAAFQNALTVYTKNEMPQYWATTHSDLCMLMLDEGLNLDQGLSLDNDKSLPFFADAAEHCQNALQVFTLADVPRYWGTTQMNLGNAYLNLAKRSPQEKSLPLLAQAMQAYQSALLERTKIDHPLDWALIQSNIALVLIEQGKRADSDNARTLLETSLRSSQNALTIYTKEASPMEWARAQNNIGIALMEEAKISTPQKAADLFSQSLLALQSSLEIYKQSTSPKAYAKTQEYIDTIHTLQAALLK